MKRRGLSLNNFRILFVLLEAGNIKRLRQQLELYYERAASFEARFHCDDCGLTPPPPFMVHDAVWAAAGMKEKGHLCFGCLEVRLGRPLVIEDFTTYPINEGVRRGFELGRRFS